MMSLRSKGRSLVVIGLMSGTSCDGVDAAAVRVSARGPENRGPEKNRFPEIAPEKILRLLHFTKLSYPRPLQRALSEITSLGVRDVCRLNADLGEAFARAAIKCAEEGGIPLERIDAVASHGQTLWHIPPAGGRIGSTLQVGEPAVIARRTGLPVVSDFRAADMAEGGQGAPLVPYADHMMFRRMAPVAVHNLGGISNVTLVTPELEDVRAFDTGPGNCLMDAAMRRYFRRSYDRGGAKARRGRVHERVLARLLRHPYFRKRPPKSTGPETFGLDMLEDAFPFSGGVGNGVGGEDVLATLARFTAQSIAEAYRRQLLPGSGVSEAIFSGGGTANTFLMELIGELLSPLKISLSDDYAVPSRAKEAMAFALLGAEALKGREANLPGVTGASRRVRLGSITLP